MEGAIGGRAGREAPPAGCVNKLAGRKRSADRTVERGGTKYNLAARTPVSFDREAKKGGKWDGGGGGGRRVGFSSHLLSSFVKSVCVCVCE